MKQKNLPVMMDGMQGVQLTKEQMRALTGEGHLSYEMYCDILDACIACGDMHTYGLLTARYTQYTLLWELEARKDVFSDTEE